MEEPPWASNELKLKAVRDFPRRYVVRGPGLLLESGLLLYPIPHTRRRGRLRVLNRRGAVVGGLLAGGEGPGCGAGESSW